MRHFYSNQMAFASFVVTGQTTLDVLTGDVVEKGNEIKMVCEASFDSSIQWLKKQGHHDKYLFGMNNMIMVHESQYKERMTLDEEVEGSKKRFILTIQSK